LPQDIATTRGGRSHPAQPPPAIESLLREKYTTRVRAVTSKCAPQTAWQTTVKTLSGYAVPIPDRNTERST
jgi:hypothetical protein